MFYIVTNLDCTNLVEREIKLEDDTPFKEPYGSVPSFLIQELESNSKKCLMLVLSATQKVLSAQMWQLFIKRWHQLDLY